MDGYLYFTILTLFEYLVNTVRGLIRFGYCLNNTRLDGKVAIVTGASAGIGKELSLELAKRGAKVIMACRDMKKAKSALDEIKAVIPEGNLVPMHLELASFESIKKFAKQVLDSEDEINILVNNAGVFLCPYRKTDEGFEMHFGVNYLGHVLLTFELLERMKKSENPKMIFVSSSGHFFSRINFEDINLEKCYERIAANNQGQLAKVLFVKEFARRCKEIKSYVLMPGWIRTEIEREINVMFHHNILFLIASKITQFLFFRSPFQGIQTILHCILDEQADQESGLYYNDCKAQRSGDQTYDKALLNKFWGFSCDLVGYKQFAQMETV